MTGAHLRRISGLSGALLLIEAIALWLLLATAPTRVLLPIALDLAADPHRFVLVHLDLGFGAVVLCLFVGVARLLAITPGIFPIYYAHMSRDRHPARWFEFAFSSSIVVFLVAQLNGITDIGTLVLSYAATSAMTLFFVLEERTPRPATERMLPLWFGAAIGIVPWGVIALHQIAGLLVGQPPSGLGRVITLVMLGFSFAFFIVHWLFIVRRREQRGIDSARPSAGEAVHILLSLVSTSVFAWLVVLGVVIGQL
ncbi:heliorhodopsin HeR [Lacisediminihabitans sp. H27-G8]|uniref:heliorhodopsin HeR n=1 Tax=Lacisediminihabitans sp. H27-G8 TaxID=3111909 RepID=UPI0038FC5796